MDKIKVYLVGSMTGFMEDGSYEKATEWREYAKQKLEASNLKVFDPTENSIQHYQYPASLNGGIITQNYTFIQRCDLLLVNLEKLEDSIGSIWEISMAWQQRKPVVAFGRCEKWEGRPHFQSLITVRLADGEAACDYIISMYANSFTT